MFRIHLHGQPDCKFNNFNNELDVYELGYSTRCGTVAYAAVGKNQKVWKSYRVYQIPN